MRILHTSDWHLGQNFNDFDRSDEHAVFFEHLYAMARDRRPDVIVVSGDIFDTTAPPIGAQDMYNRQMIRLSELKIPIVVTAGNHDSASRLEVSEPLWSRFGLAVVGNLQFTPDGQVDTDRHIVEIPDKGFVVAVPYIYKYRYPEIPDKADATIEERMEYFHNILLKRAAERNTAKLPVVMTAHLAVAENAEKTDYDERIAAMEFCNIKSMGKGWDYLALGHIHRPYDTWNKHVRYCGSPIPLSFDETTPRSVSVVDIESLGAEPRIEEVEIPQMRRMLTVPAEPKPLNEAVAELAMLKADEECYVRLNLLITDLPDGDAGIRAQNALQGKKARYCGTKLTKAIFSPATDSTQPLVSVANINNDPMAIAKAYYLQKNGVDMPDDISAMLKFAIDETINQNRL